MDNYSQYRIKLESKMIYLASVTKIIEDCNRRIYIKKSYIHHEEIKYYF